MRPEFLPDVLRPSVTVDMVILTLMRPAPNASVALESTPQLHVLLVERGLQPFQGELALPGGFVRVGPGGEGGEHLDDAAARELVEETGLSRAQVLLEQLGAFGAPGRDPRERVITVAYFALVRPELAAFVHAGSDAAAARWLPVRALAHRPLAFDHRAIIEAALERVRHDVERSGLSLHLVPETFTIAELRAVHEAVEDHRIDPGNFRRRFLWLVERGVIEPAPGKRITGRKHAAVYRAARAGVSPPAPHRS